MQLYIIIITFELILKKYNTSFRRLKYECQTINTYKHMFMKNRM